MIALIVVWGLLFAADDADPPGLHERDDPVEAAGDDPLLRLADELDRRRLGAAGARRAADVWGYAPSYLLSAGISALALPFSGALAAPERARRHGHRRRPSPPGARAPAPPTDAGARLTASRLA